MICSGCTGVRISMSSLPIALASAHSTDDAADADARLADALGADDRVAGIGNVERLPLRVDRNVEHRRRLVVIHPLADGDAVVRVVDQLLAARCAPMPWMRAAENLSAETARVEHRADVRDRDVVDDAVDAGLDVDFDFGEAGDEAVGLTVARIAVARGGHEALARPAPTPTSWSSR